MATIKQVQGDRYPVITVTFRDAGDPSADKTDPDTWPVVDLSSNVTHVRVDYYTAREQYLDVTVSATDDTITKTNQKLDNGDRVRIASSGTVPGGLDDSTLYYVVGSSGNSFQLSATEGGAAIDITSVGTGQHNIYRLYDTVQATLVGGGSGGQVSFTHPNLVWENPGTYTMEYIVRWTSPAGTETVYDRDTLELRQRTG